MWLMLLAATVAQAQAPGPQPAPATQPTGTPAAQQKPRTAQRRGGGGRTYPTYAAGAVERGQKQFLATCAFCHGSNAKGGESGPDLLRSPVVLDDDHGDHIGPVVLNGRPEKGMPKFPLSTEQISDISAFLLDRVKAASERGTYEILNIVTGDPKAGQAYFNGPGGCTKCHSVTGDLAHIGSKYDPVTIQQRVVMPREGRGGFMQPPRPVAEAVTVTVTLPSGQSFRGRVEHIDDFVVSLTDANGDYHSFSRNGDVPKVEIHDPIQAHTDMLLKYTDTDIHNLTAYLVTLK
ncbi:MAG: c-type cytochrome [Acidobacteria bacterium]|nr:c-type cytochrome [Acidobacteriota bacterium]